MSKKKKTNQKKDIVGIIIIFVIAILSLLLLYVGLLNNRTSFKIENRNEQIKKSIAKDTNGFETAAWLRVEGTNIDYPIVFDYSGQFLNPVEKTSYGWLNSNTKTYKNNLTIDGHNINNLGVPKKSSKKFTRFEELMAYVYYDFAKENQFIQLTMDGKDYLYQIFAVAFMYDLDFGTLPYDTADKETQQNNIDFIKEQSIYDYDIDVGPNNYILNVATCTRLFGKEDRTNFVVSAKRIDNKVRKYNEVRKTKKYEKVDEKMKGSENNESTDENETA